MDGLSRLFSAKRAPVGWHCALHTRWETDAFMRCVRWDQPGPARLFEAEVEVADATPALSLLPLTKRHTTLANLARCVVCPPSSMLQYK